MDLKTQITLLAALVRGSVDEVYPCLAASSVATDDFRAFLAYHQLLGFVGYVLCDHPLLEKMPEALREDLVTHARKLGWKNETARKTLPLVNTAFQETNTPFILLKGVHIALRYYGGLERRTFWDMDILVHPANLVKAQQQLFSCGYELASRVFVTDRLSRFFTHALDMRKPGGLDIDLHWKLANHPGLRLDYKAIWESSRTLTLEGHSFSVLSDEYVLAFLLISIVKDIERGSLRLRSMVDLYKILEMMDADTDWPRFFKDRGLEGVEVISMGALSVFFALFQVRPDEFPRLQQEVNTRSNTISDLEEALMLLQPRHFALQNKQWASGLYSVSRMGYLWWWGISLPARLIVHQPPRKPGKKARN